MVETVESAHRDHDLLYVPLREHMEAMRAETDRRYSEVSLEREKALAIKENAEKAALELARQIQTYKDEKANELREQINRERGLYASKDDLLALAGKIDANLQPLRDYVAGQQGRSGGQTGLMVAVSGAVALILGLIGIFAFLQKEPKIERVIIDQPRSGSSGSGSSVEIVP